MADSQTLTPTKLEGRVAQILNARELVINLGSEQGIKPGMKFAVLAEEPVEVRDPISGEVLDTVDRPKVNVEVWEIRPKITICRTFRVKSRTPAGILYSGGMFPNSIVEMLAPSKEVIETLRAKDASLPAPLSEEHSYVKMGDRVVQIIE